MTTWNRAELSRLLLEYGGKSCDAFDGRGFGECPCANCGYQYSQHLAKHAAEEIGVLDAQLRAVASDR